MNLAEWTVAFIKYKDSVLKRIEYIEKHEGYILVTFKNKSTQKYLCVSGLKTLDLKSLKGERLVCYNTRENINWVIQNWDSLKDIHTIFYFVNLDKMESWALNPKMHHNITEKESLKNGLLALFESVSEVK